MAEGRWIADHVNLIITGPTGSGKTWLSCAFGHRAARDDHSVLYARTPRLLEDLAVARADGRYPRLLASLAKVRLLILADAILDRLVHSAHRIEIRGESMRKRFAEKTLGA